MPRDHSAPRPGRRRVEEEATNHTMSQSQMTQQSQSLTQAQRAADSLPPDVINRRVSDFVQYMLIMETKKLPVKRADLNKNVMKEHRNILPEVMRRGKLILHDVFGYELVEAEHSTSGKNKQKLYFLLNNLASNLTQDLVPEPDESKLGLLWTILALIFMHEGAMPDKQLWHLLSKLGLRTGQDERDDPVFGDIKKTITQDFTRQLYLEMVKLPNTDPVEYEFKWGMRAAKEISKESIIKAVAELYGDNVNPKVWKTQYREVLLEKGLDPDAFYDNDEEGAADQEQDMDED
ncbi:non-structural maintenance of chromosomes element 3 homolog [Diadema antillarum]|uniref:non-structural maintenance of chromosomes element 3 homolog n=1 Tax=Diadema antillarum TaxID=105358 RepID=UPI003A86DF99